MIKQSPESYQSLFLNLKGRSNQNTDSKIIILEGWLLFERMLNCGMSPLAVLCTPELHEDVLQLLPSPCPIEVLSEAEISAIAGYNFHRGILSASSLPEQISSADWLHGCNDTSACQRLIVLPRLTDPTNVGSIYRSAQAFGWNAVMLGAKCASPFGRKALRVSMGASLSLPTIVLKGPQDLLTLQNSGFIVIGAVLNDDACNLEDIAMYIQNLEQIQKSPQSIALVLGHEYDGLSPEWLKACTTQATIPMVDNHDSLNVALASALFMYRLGRGTRS